MKLSDILNELDFSSEGNHKPNYMVIQNLKQIARNVTEILEMDESRLLEIMDEHPWAVDHLSTSKDDIEEVCNFLKENITQ